MTDKDRERGYEVRAGTASIPREAEAPRFPNSTGGVPALAHLHGRLSMTPTGTWRFGSPSKENPSARPEKIEPRTDAELNPAEPMNDGP